MLNFEGEVRSGRGSGAINLWLQGYSRSDATAARETEVLFSGATPSELPSSLHDVKVFELEGNSQAARRYRIESREVQLEVQVRSAQVHRAAAEMFDAVPPPRVPWRVRAGWVLLLYALRLPALMPLISGRRAAS
jgi:hypothetical protein